MPVRELKSDEEVVTARELRPDEEVVTDSPDPTFINRGLANLAGTPVDVTSDILSVVGLGSDRPIGGSRSIEQGFRWLEQQGLGRFVPGEDERADEPGEYIARGVGEAAGALLPAYGLASKAAQSSRPVVSGVGRAVTPSTAGAGAAELTAGAGAGAGRFAGERAAPEGQEQLGAALGELGGGIIGGGLGAAARGATRAAEKTPVAGTVMRAGKAALFPFTEAGGRVRASRRVRDLSEDPEEARQNLTETEGEMPPAQKTGEPRLMALERAVRDQDPQLDRELRERMQQSTRALAEEMTGGDPEAMRSFIESRRGRVLGALDARMKMAQRTAEERIEQAAPQMERGEPARIVREEVESALADARKQENALWRQVPEDATVSTQPLRQAYEQLVANTPRTQRDDIPSEIKRFLDPESNERLAEEESLAELQGLRSSLLSTARQARASGDRNTARIAENMANETLENMQQADEAGEAIDTARAFSRLLNEKFRQGEIGRVLGTAREGDPRVPEELTLEQTVGRGGERGAVAEQQLVRAVENAPEEARKGIADYLRQRFVDAAVDDGKVSPQKARRFVQQNERILDRYPDLKRAFSSAEEGQKVADRVTQTAIRLKKNLQTPSKSYTSRYLSGDVDDEIETLFKARNPTAMARELKRQVSKDDSGQALSGLKGAVLDNLTRRARTVDPEGYEWLRGSALRDALGDKRSQQALKTVFSDTEYKRLQRIASELSRMEQARGRLPSVGGPIEDLPNSILSTMAQVIGAQAGRQVAEKTGGGTVQTPGIFAGRLKGFLERMTSDRAEQLIRDAVRDEDLFRALLAGPEKPPKKATRKLNAWMLGPASPDRENGSER